MQEITLTDILKLEQAEDDFNFSVKDIQKYSDSLTPDKKTAAIDQNYIPPYKRELARYPKNQLLYDKYRFTVYEKTRDLRGVNENELRKVDVKIFPLDRTLTQIGHSLTSGVAASIFDSENLACAATPIVGRKTRELMTKDFDFIIRGQQRNFKFESMVNPTNDGTERYRQESKKIRFGENVNSLGHPIIQYRGKKIHFMPLVEVNLNGYCPLLIVFDGDGERTMVASETYINYGDMKIGARFTNEDFILFEI